MEADRIKESEKLEAKMSEKPGTAGTMGTKLRDGQREIRRPNTTAMHTKPPTG